MELIDEYEHPNAGLNYLLESIPSQEISDIHQFSGCSCTNLCLVANCSCLQRSGMKYAHDNVLDLESYCFRNCNVDKPVYECNRNCNCNTFCGNKLVQYGPNKHLAIKECEFDYISKKTKGFGVYSVGFIKTGVFICEYAGEIITESKAKQLFLKYKDITSMNYIFCINENFGEKNYKTFIDPTCSGNIGRYINHSCDPNCDLVPIRVDMSIPKLCIFAKRDLAINEEITFDYGVVSNMNLSNDEKCEKTPCLCLSSNCKKFLPFHKI